MARLIASGAGAEAVTVPQPITGGCGVAPGGPILGCEFALVFADYVRVIIAPLGAGTLGTKVDSIETGPGYQCRNRNNFPGGKISAHAKGIAIDLVAVRFADNGASRGNIRMARLKLRISGRRGRRLAVGLRQCSDRAPIRFTPPTCTSTPRATVRTEAIAFANSARSETVDRRVCLQ
jgi:hypothetical protein